MATEFVSAKQTPTETTTIRVSVRELAEVTRWAFVAAGCSAGEAAVAGRIVQRAEVQSGWGVAAAIRELMSHRFSSEPIRRVPGPIETIDDQHGRGLLTLGPLAAALASARGVGGGAVVIRDMAWHPVVGCILVDALHSSAPNPNSLAAWPLPAHGVRLATDQGVVAHADSVATAGFDPQFMEPPTQQRVGSLAGTAGPNGGIAFATVSPVLISTSPESEADALASGVHVDLSDWTFLYEAAQRFLVDES
ncbi:MAG: hypothetical protein ACRBK7_27715 [Acidimicrobiales bacterium]